MEPVKVLMTAYVPKPGSLTTAENDANATPGIATDYGAFSKGTKILIPGKGIFSVDDTGAIPRRDWRLRHIRHIDLRIPPRYHFGTNPADAFRAAIDEANSIGIGWVQVYVIKPPVSRGHNS